MPVWSFFLCRSGPREGRAWLVGCQGTRGVLRQLPVPVVSGTVLTQDVAWLHGFLTRLAGLGFPRPGRFAALMGSHGRGGRLALGDRLVPARPYDRLVSRSADGGGRRTAGRYHATVRQIEVTSQRPAALPLADVPEVLLSRKLDVVPLEKRANIRQLAAQLACDLDGTGHLHRERVVIHGDFTNDNVIADGTPPHATGVIDFANAHVETPLADVGYGLWRSGRPHERADSLDFSEPADSCAVMPASFRSRPTRPASFPSTCGAGGSR